MLLLFGFGCKGLSAEERAAIRTVNIDYWAVHENVAVLRQFAEEYRQLRPYVNINIRRVREDEIADLFVNALADDVPPDIISIPIRELPAYQSRLAPMPRSVSVANVYRSGGLSDAITVEPVQVTMPTINTIERTYISGVADQIVDNNAVWGFPLAVDTLALYYNNTLFDQAGIPEPPSNWDEFKDSAKKLTRFDSNGRVIQSGVSLGGYGNMPHQFDVLSLLWLQNGLPLSRAGVSILQSGVNSRSPVELTAHPTFQALRFYTDFARPEKDTYTWNETFADARNEFARGRVGMYFGFAYEQAVIRAQAPQLNYSIVPVPQLDPTNPKNVLQFSIQAVPKNSPDRDEAWDFIRFISQETNIARYLSAEELPTPLRSQVTMQVEIPALEPFVSSILTAENWYRGNAYAAAQRASADLIEAYLAPYPEGERAQTQSERDAGILTRMVQTIQQTQ